MNTWARADMCMNITSDKMKICFGSQECDPKIIKQKMGGRKERNIFENVDKQ